MYFRHVEGLLEAMVVMHSHGIIHGDIKMDNAMLSIADGVKVIAPLCKEV